MTSRGLSKSRIAAFELCPKKLWLSVHKRDEAVVDPSSQMRFDTGNEIGQIAQQLLPADALIDGDTPLSDAIDITKEQIADADQAIIFEATFSFENVLVQVDVLERGPDDSWIVREVKSSTKWKDYHVGDLATQVWVLENSGLKVSSANIQCIDNQFVLEASGNYQGLFTEHELSAEIAPLVASRAEVVAAAKEALDGEEPNVEMGGHCNKPFICEFNDYCKGPNGQEVEWPISELPNSGKKVAAKWAESGRYDLRELSSDDLPNAMHKRVHEAVVSGQAYHDVKAIRAEVDAWSYPRTFLDFETMSFAAPRWIGTKPYEQVPFQFSAFIEHADGEISSVDFLDLTGTDPRTGCITTLKELPETGSVIAWNASFEKRCLKSLAEFDSGSHRFLSNLEDRTVDLWPVAKKHYYHRDQRASWSIKAVLPTLVEQMSYGSLEIQGGESAQIAYLRSIDPDCPEDERTSIRAALLEYCRQDSIAMIMLLYKLCGKEFDVELLEA